MLFLLGLELVLFFQLIMFKTNLVRYGQSEWWMCNSLANKWLKTLTLRSIAMCQRTSGGSGLSIGIIRSKIQDALVDTDDGGDVSDQDHHHKVDHHLVRETEPFLVQANLNISWLEIHLFLIRFVSFSGDLPCYYIMSRPIKYRFGGHTDLTWTKQNLWEIQIN